MIRKCLILSVLIAAATRADEPRSALKAPISLTDMNLASKSIQAWFESKGRHGLAKLAQDEDIMIALHARWETAKGDKAKTEEFVAAFDKLLKVKSPKWWRTRLSRVQVYRGKHHYVQVPRISESDFQKSCQLTHDNLMI